MGDRMDRWKAFNKALENRTRNVDYPETWNELLQRLGRDKLEVFRSEPLRGLVCRAMGHEWYSEVVMTDRSLGKLPWDMRERFTVKQVWEAVLEVRERHGQAKDD